MLDEETDDAIFLIGAMVTMLRASVYGIKVTDDPKVLEGAYRALIKNKLACVSGTRIELTTKGRLFIEGEIIDRMKEAIK